MFNVHSGHIAVAVLLTSYAVGADDFSLLFFSRHFSFRVDVFLMSDC